MPIWEIPRRYVTRRESSRCTQADIAGSFLGATTSGFAVDTTSLPVQIHVVLSRRIVFYVRLLPAAPTRRRCRFTTAAPTANQVSRCPSHRPPIQHPFIQVQIRLETPRKYVVQFQDMPERNCQENTNGTLQKVSSVTQ